MSYSWHDSSANHSFGTSVIEVVHLTAHLGGGVGKALSELVMATKAAATPVRHVFACLDRPEKSQFLDRIERYGGEVLVEPDSSQLASRLINADIVQLEWWNHPATIAALCNLPPLPMRLVVWSHVSGLYNPIIPPALVEVSDRFILTSPCSRGVKTVSEAMVKNPQKIEVISSAGGVDMLPQVEQEMALANEPLSVGYLGSLNFTKLHPDFVSWAAAVRLPDFHIRLIGDPVNQSVLSNQAAALGRPDLFEFIGYTTDVAGVLASLDVLIYMLNPHHYGTAENALVEAMAMGVVPIVLDNPAERCIVENGVTGIVISSGYELPDVLEHLVRNPGERLTLSKRASQVARDKFSSASMAESFRKQYQSLLATPSHPVVFKSIFGDTPADWFLACQNDSKLYGTEGRLNISPGLALPEDLFEHTKGSVLHFHRYFPEDPRLRSWVWELEQYRC